MRAGADKRTGASSLAPRFASSAGAWWNAVLVAAMVSVGLAACHGCHEATPSSPTAPPVASTGTPTLRIYFVSDLAGAIEPCGCTKDQLGGLDHAAAWIDAQKAHAPWSVLVAAGPTFFMDPVLEPDHRAQDVAKAEALASSLAHLGLAAWAPAANDWADGAPELKKLEDVVHAPGLLANLRADAGVPLLPTRVVTVHGVRVAFIGVGEPPKTSGLATGSPEDAVKAASQAARAGGANVVIALASVGRGEAKRIADAVPDLTAIVVGDASLRGDTNTPAPSGEAIGKVLIAEAADHLQSVGALDLYVRDGSYTFADASGLGEAQKLTELTRRIDELHSRISNWERDKSIAPADLVARRADLDKLEAERAGLSVKPAPAEGSYFRYTLQEIRPSRGPDHPLKTDLASYYRLVNETNRVELAGRVPVPPAAGQPGYVGIDRCGGCHTSEKHFWAKTAHAKAYATLSDESKEFNLDCVSCHVTGYDRPGGSTVTHVDKLKDVQCEVCHGPGSLHAESPTTVSIPTPKPGAQMCLSCHHPPHVEGFDAVAKMSAILGPGHGR
jgi:hypothetical protein